MSAFQPLFQINSSSHTNLSLPVGLSFIFLGLHYPTDVLVGALLGTGIGFSAARFLQYYS